MRKITQEGLDLIKLFEGFSSTVYICPAGCLTIGLGHLIRDHEAFDTISREEAEVLLREDVESAELCRSAVD